MADQRVRSAVPCCAFFLTLPCVQGRGRGATRGSRGGPGGARGGGPGRSDDKPRREAILDLSKYVDKQVRVKFTGGREGQSPPLPPSPPAPAHLPPSPPLFAHPQSLLAHASPNPKSPAPSKDTTSCSTSSWMTSRNSSVVRFPEQRARLAASCVDLQPPHLPQIPKQAFLLSPPKLALLDLPFSGEPASSSSVQLTGPSLSRAPMPTLSTPSSSFLADRVRLPTPLQARDRARALGTIGTRASSLCCRFFPARRFSSSAHSRRAVTSWCGKEGWWGTFGDRVES